MTAPNPINTLMPCDLHLWLHHKFGISQVLAGLITLVSVRVVPWIPAVFIIGPRPDQWITLVWVWLSSQGGTADISAGTQPGLQSVIQLVGACDVTKPLIFLRQYNVITLVR